ncbi:SphA family protein [Mucilaginibacter sp.]
MKIFKVFFAISVSLFLYCGQAIAQDPRLPPTNLGLSNMQDGNPPTTGWYFQEFLQNYQSLGNRGPNGANVGGVRINSFVSINQLLFISKTKVAGGNLGFTLIVPVVRLSASNYTGLPPTINPNPMGDIIAGPFIQWFNKKLFNMHYGHRFEIDVVAPVGAYQSSYLVNPGSHLFTIVPHYTFTISPTDKFSISMRHHLNYYFDEIGTQAKPGMSYNLNYSLEYAINSSLRAEIAGYYLKQFVQDSNNGNYHYYQDNFDISDTREQVLAFGPGLGYVTPSGLFIEIKGMREFDVRNRSDGFRSTLVLSYKLDK